MSGIEEPSTTRVAAAIVAITVALVLGALPVVGQGPAASGPAADDPPRHDPIRIEGDQDLLTPPPIGDDNGVRRGTGTADDPFVIENWTLRADAEPSILVQDTTLHLVIQDLAFEGPGEWERIGVENAENVTIRRLDLDGPPNGSWQGAGAPALIWGTASHRISVEDLRAEGETRFTFVNSKDVRMKGVAFRGWTTYVEFAGGSYEVEDLVFDNAAGDHGGAYGVGRGKIWLSTAEQGPDEPCSVRAENISIRGAEGYGIQMTGGPCNAVLRDIEVTSGEAGVVAEQGAHIDLDDASLLYVHTSRDPPSPGYRHGVAGLRADREFMGGAGNLDAGENAPGTIAARNVTIDGYWHGVTSRGGGFDLEDVRIQDHRIGVYASGACDPCEIHDSSILGSQDMHVLNQGSSTVDARRNWWGSPDGPPADMVEGDVLVEPWKTEGPAPPMRSGEGLPGFGVAGVLVAAAAVAVGTGRRRRAG